MFATLDTAIRITSNEVIVLGVFLILKRRKQYASTE